MHRAYEIADQLTKNDINAAEIPAVSKEEAASDVWEKKDSKKSSGKKETPGQLSLFGAAESDYSEVIETLKNVDISQMTPISDMNKLYELQEMLKK